MTIILTIVLILIILFLVVFLNKKETFYYESEYDDIHGPAQDAFSNDLDERINIVSR